MNILEIGIVINFMLILDHAHFASWLVSIIESRDYHFFARGRRNEKSFFLSCEAQNSYAPMLQPSLTSGVPGWRRPRAASSCSARSLPATFGKILTGTVCTQSTNTSGYTDRPESIPCFFSHVWNKSGKPRGRTMSCFFNPGLPQARIQLCF